MPRRRQRQLLSAPPRPHVISRHARCWPARAVRGIPAARAQPIHPKGPAARQAAVRSAGTTRSAEHSGHHARNAGFLPIRARSLLGYSEGAWITILWELQYPAEAVNLYSAGLIGDPCYTDAIGDAGLARIYTASCSSAADYILGETNIQPIPGRRRTRTPHCAVNGG
jgi:hypothetical protein